MFLRNAQIDDLERIMEILSDGRLSLASLGIDQWQGSYPYRDVVERDIKSGESYVVEDAEGKLQATAMIGFGGESTYQYIDQGAWLTAGSIDQPCYAVIHRIAVAGTRKGLGLASFILREAEKLALASGCASIRIDTHAGNYPMLGLLAKAGYTRCGVVFIDHAEGSDPSRIAYEKLVLQYRGAAKTA